MVTGAPGQFTDGGLGAAYRYVAGGGLLRGFVPASPDWPDRFGSSVALGDGVAVIGARTENNGQTNDAGAVYVFDTATGNQLHRFTSPDPVFNAQYGTDVAVEGNLALVGAPQDNVEAGFGAAYLYDITTGDLLHELTPNDHDYLGLFGYRVNIFGTTAIIGDRLDALHAPGGNFTSRTLFSSGSAYLFDTTTGNQIGKLTAFDAEEDDNYSQDVAISGSYAIVGSWFDDEVDDSSGSAYLYSIDGPPAGPIEGTLEITTDPDTPATLADAVELASSQTAVSWFTVNGYLITGDDAGLFTLPDFAEVEVRTTSTDTVQYDLYFSGEAVGTYNATLTLLTSEGKVHYSIEATVPGAVVLGDLNGDGTLTNGDIAAFVLALTDPTGYAAAYPDLNPDEVGDFSRDGSFTNGDISGFVDALTGAGSSSLDLTSLRSIAVPEPTSLGLLGLGWIVLARCRRG